jgi:hypothetical protein
MLCAPASRGCLSRFDGILSAWCLQGRLWFEHRRESECVLFVLSVVRRKRCSEVFNPELGMASSSDVGDLEIFKGVVCFKQLSLSCVATSLVNL